MTTTDAWDELAAADPRLADELMGRVARGAELLDRKLPRWWKSVEADLLDMISRKYCVLGQVCGSYEKGFDRLRLDMAAHERASDYGFALRVTEEGVPPAWRHGDAVPPESDLRFNAIGALWRRQVRSRLAAAGEVGSC